MIQSVQDLFSQSTSKGDTATILIAGTAGLVVDAGLNLIGFLEPGVVGLGAASGALGLKKSWEANRAQRRAAKHGERAVDRARALLAILREQQRSGLAAELEQELAYFEKDIIDDDGLDGAVRATLDKLRASPQAAPGSAAVAD
jgi:hypothetical protein